MNPKPANPGMTRRKFSSLLASLAFGSLPLMAKPQASVQPEQFVFKDDGAIPNNRLPLLLYKQAFSPDIPALASAIEDRFASNNWTGSWRASVFTFHHFHSTTHVVLGVYRGSATLQLGGEQGQKFDVKPGEIIVIPVGVGHKRIASTEDFGVVGAYPGGRQWDLLRGMPGERPQADRNIASVPLPETDPIHGVDGPLRKIWATKPPS
ncbi:MAG TPA: hypothetical protein VIS96_09325 [Terrimicrobiaceae bacterium]